MADEVHKQCCILFVVVVVVFTINLLKWYTRCRMQTQEEKASEQYLRPKVKSKRDNWKKIENRKATPAEKIASSTTMTTGLTKWSGVSKWTLNSSFFCVIIICFPLLLLLFIAQPPPPLHSQLSPLPLLSLSSVRFSIRFVSNWSELNADECIYKLTYSHA